ncbi:MAG: hypothetical protein D4S02_06005, partial [Rhodocyclaceae bacterium]
MMVRAPDWFDALRYDRPGWFRVLLVGVVGIAWLVAFMLLPELPVLRVMGVSAAQERVKAVPQGIMWSARALLHQRGPGDSRLVYGNVEGIDSRGRLIATVAIGSNWEHLPLTLANIVITDVYGAARIVGGVRGENARLEVYAREHVVVWIRNVPLNLKLIEAGVAKPDPLPPSNIFDQAFAT